MTKILRIILFIIMTFVLVVFNIKLLPARREIVDLELVRIIGLDSYDDSVELSVIRDKTKSSSSIGESSNKSGQSIMSEIGKTFIQVSRKFQTSTNREITLSHVSYFLIGELTAKNNIIQEVNFLAGDEQLRTSSNLYIVKGMSSKEFLQKVIDSEYKLDSKLDSMELTKNINGIIGKISFKDVLKTITDKTSVGVVPTLRLEETNTQNSNKTDNKRSSNFEFDGYAVLEGGKVVHFLTKEQSIAYNIIKNDIDMTNINIKNNKDEYVALSAIDFKTKIKFEFDGDILKKIIVNVQFKSGFEEAENEEIMINEREELEKKQSEYIQKDIIDIINFSKEMNIDILNILENLKRSHPYKYEKIKNNWKNIWKEVPVEINVQSKIQRAYDLISL